MARSFLGGTGKKPELIIRRVGRATTAIASSCLMCLIFAAAANAVDIDAGGAIPDGDPGGASFTFTVSGVGTIQDAVVRLAIEHPNVGDIIVELTSPQATTVRLRNESGGLTDDIPDLLFEPTPCPFGETCSAVDGPGSLSDFVGENADGVWTLFVSDVCPGPPPTCIDNGSVLAPGEAAPWGTAKGTKLILSPLVLSVPAANSFWLIGLTLALGAVAVWRLR